MCHLRWPLSTGTMDSVSLVKRWAGFLNVTEVVEGWKPQIYWFPVHLTLLIKAWLVMSIFCKYSNMASDLSGI